MYEIMEVIRKPAHHDLCPVIQKKAPMSTNNDSRAYEGRVYLWYDDVCQRSWQGEQFHSVLQAQGTVVLNIILHTVIDVWNLADVVASVLHVEVPLQFRPALEHHLQSLTVVQL